eukprot:gene14032-14147_t
MAVLTDGGSLVSPTEFERLSGKGSSKKWKCTLRVRKANGLPGITMGDWLLQMGYDQPKPPAGVAGEAGPGAGRASLNDIRRQQASRMKAVAAAAAEAVRDGGAVGPAAGGATPGSVGVKLGPSGQTITSARGVSLHREGCLCVICKQARRKAAQEAGLPPDPQDAYVPRPNSEGGSSKPAAGSRGAAYGGAQRGLGSSSAGAGQTTAAAAAAAGVAAAGGQLVRAKIKLPDVMLGKRAYVRAVPHLVRGSAVHKLWDLPECKAYTAEEWEAKQVAEAAAGDGDGNPAGEASASAALAGQGGGSSRRSETLREKLRVSRSLERERITFGKSGIHGWGIFARQPIKQDSLVSEFRGQV